MGTRLRADDIRMATFFELFNLRFAASKSSSRGARDYGGVAEMAALQREFRVFRKGRPFVDSAALLGLGGLNNDPDKNRWFEILAHLPDYGSDTEGENADQRIVGVLIENLAQRHPQPCIMQAHDGREEGRSRVFILKDNTPYFYIESVKFLTISLPMRPAG